LKSSVDKEEKVPPPASAALLEKVVRLLGPEVKSLVYELAEVNREHHVWTRIAHDAERSTIRKPHGWLRKAFETASGVGVVPELRQSMSWPSAAERLQVLADEYEWTDQEREALTMGARACRALGENIPRGTPDYATHGRR
jgi:hypothetical protein